MLRYQAPPNRSEPTPSYDRTRNSYDYSSVRLQLGRTKGGNVSYDPHNLDARGVLSLENRSSWLPDPSKGDYRFSGQTVTETCWITDFANMAGPIQQNQFDYTAGYDWASFLWNGQREPGSWVDVNSIWRDPSMMSQVQEIFHSGIYCLYDAEHHHHIDWLGILHQLVQFNDLSNITQTDFIHNGEGWLYTGGGRRGRLEKNHAWKRCW